MNRKNYIIPSLIEPGTKYFLKETLKNCRKKKNKYYSELINLGLFCFFFVLFGGIIYYKYRTRPDDESRKKKQHLKQTYILSKIQSLTDKVHKKEENRITNLPRFESDFELLHKNFYKI